MKTTALITGATRGIGLSLAHELVARGVTVYATGRDALALSRVKAASGAFGAPFDLSDRTAPLAVYQDACEVLGGPPDFLVNNAGFNRRKARWVDVTDDELDELYAVNFRAPAALCRYALGDMARRAQETERVGGHIVNVLSTVVHFANETMGAYTAMKHALHGLTEVLIKEGRQARVKVSGVYPGGTDSDFRPETRPDYLRPDSVAQMIAAVLFAPPDVVVHELTFRPMVEANF